MAKVKVVVHETELYPVYAVRLFDEHDGSDRAGVVEIDQALLDKHRAAVEALEETDREIGRLLAVAGVKI